MSPPLRSVTDRDRLASCRVEHPPGDRTPAGGSGSAALGDFCSVERGVLRLPGPLPTHDLGRLIQGPVAEVEGVYIVFEWPRPHPPAWKDDPWEVGGIGAVDGLGRWSSLPDLGTRRTGTVPAGPETG